MRFLNVRGSALEKIGQKICEHFNYGLVQRERLVFFMDDIPRAGCKFRAQMELEPSRDYVARRVSFNYYG